MRPRRNQYAGELWMARCSGNVAGTGADPRPLTSGGERMNYFVTGGTGFLGRFLIGNLLKRKGTVYVLVRKESQKKFDALAKKMGWDPKRVIAVHGDMTKPKCGLTAAQVRSFPYEAAIETDGVPVHSGPDGKFYETSRLKRGSRVTVHRHDPGGWYMIAPPAGEFGLVKADEVDGRRTFKLTDAGQAEAARVSSSGQAPWDAAAEGEGEGMGKLRDLAMQVGAATLQVAHAGTAAQVEQASAILRDTRKALYRILAEGDDEAS